MLSVVEAQEIMTRLPDIFGTEAEDPVYKAGVLLLVGLGRRKHLDDLTRVTKYDREFVRSCLANLRMSKVWEKEDRTTYANWTDNPLEFMLDILVALGRIERVAATK